MTEGAHGVPPPDRRHRRIKGQLGAFRDLGALPDDVDLDWVIEELRLDGELFDPTRCLRKR